MYYEVMQETLVSLGTKYDTSSIDSMVPKSIRTLGGKSH